MPGKINPVMPEMIAMVSFQAVGTDVATALAVQAGQLELNVMMPTMAWNVLHTAEILKNGTRQFTALCVEGITANKERCKFYAEATVSLATALNPYIGYARTAEIVKQAVKQGRRITEIALEKKLVDEKLLRKILDPRRMTEPAPPIKEAVAEKKPAAKAAAANGPVRRSAAANASKKAARRIAPRKRGRR
jgi:aspartate ammonia-lyase